MMFLATIGAPSTGRVTLATQSTRGIAETEQHQYLPFLSLPTLFPPPSLDAHRVVNIIPISVKWRNSKLGSMAASRAAPRAEASPAYTAGRSVPNIVGLTLAVNLSACGQPVGLRSTWGLCRLLSSFAHSWLSVTWFIVLIKNIGIQYI